MKKLRQMTDKIWTKYNHVFWYGFYGICTTLINIIVYDICSSVFGFGTAGASAAAWALAVLFAFFTNRRYVFKSRSAAFKEKWNEFFRFAAMRLSTGLLDIAGMYIFVDFFQFNGMLMKIIMNIAVIVLNYAAGRYVVFVK